MIVSQAIRIMSLRAIFLSCLSAFGLSLAPGMLTAQTLSAEERLEAIRQSLVQRSLQGPTEVKSAAFIDGSGVLREASSFVTGMEVRGIRVLAYGRDMDELSFDSKPLPVPACHTAANSAWHHVSWQVQYSAQMPVAYQFEAQQIALQFKQQAFAQSQASPLWRLVDSHPTLDGYQKVLLGQGENHIAWQLKLSIAPSMAAGLPRTSAYDVRWTLVSRHQGTVVYTADQKISIDQPREVATSSKPLAPVVIAQIQSALAVFLQGMERELVCRVPQFDVVRVRPDTVRIAGGAASGLRVGAQMVLTDKSKLPSRALEAKALDSLAMAEVVSVSEYYAELQLKTASKTPVHPSWIAVPHTP